MKTIRIVHLAALPQPSSVRLCLTAQIEINKRRLRLPNARRSLISISYAYRKGKAFPHCAAAEPRSDRGARLSPLPRSSNLFGRKLGLGKEHQVIAATGL